MSALFPHPDIYIEQFERNHNKSISKKFVSCLNDGLTIDFEAKTGIKVNNLISVGWASNRYFFYDQGIVSKFASEIWINNINNPVVVLWSSKSGTIYGTNDTDIDCEDIQFWFEGLDPLLYHKQMFPKLEHPFKLKNLSYQLTIHRLNMDCCIEMFLKKEHSIDLEIILSKTDKFIDDFNTASEKKDRKYGVVHNWNHSIEQYKLIYDIDMGFSGPHFLKKLLEFLSALNVFDKVEVG